MYVQIDEKKIKLDTTENESQTIGKYDSKQEATEMFVALCKAIERGDKLFRMYRTGNEVEV